MKTQTDNDTEAAPSVLSTRGLSAYEEFVMESNFIERVHTMKAFNDAMMALKYVFKAPEVSLPMILKTHKYLLHNIDKEIAGKLRDYPVYIGGKKKVFVSEALLKEDLEAVIKASNAVIKWAKDKDVETKELAVKLCHIAFEDVHPHGDGNGRTYRLIYARHRKELKLPIKVIHADYHEPNSEQKEYYTWFKQTREALFDFIKENNIKIK